MRIIEFADSGLVGTKQMGPVSADICALANQFVEMDCDVTLVDTRSTDFRTFLDKRVVLEELDCSSRIEISRGKGIFGICDSWRHEKMIVKRASQKLDLCNYDIVHAHESILAHTIHRLFPVCKLVYSSHTPVWADTEYQKRLTFRQHFLHNILRLARRHEIDTIRKVPLSTCVGSFLTPEVCKRTVVYIPNGIHENEFKFTDIAFARYELGQSLDDFIITCIARLHPIKGVDVLINALRLAIVQGLSVKVNIIGSFSGVFGDNETSNYTKWLMNLSKYLPIKFYGHIKNRTEKFRHIVGGSDLVVIPSRFEAQGNVVLEAMALGVPVLASRVGGIPDMVTPEVGWLFESGDEHQLANKLLALSYNKEKLRGMRIVCRKYVENKFTWSKIAKQYYDTFLRFPK